MSETIPVRKLAIAYGTGAYGMAISTMMQFLLPLRAVELDINLAVIGLLLGSKSLVESVASVPVGGLIDRIGPRRAYQLGTAASVLLGIGYFLTSQVVVLFLLQLTFGVARPLAWVGAQSYVAGMRGHDYRSHDTGRFSFFANVGQIAAPLAVGFVSQLFSVQAAFLFLSAYSLSCLLLGLLIPEIGTDRTGNKASKRGGSFGNALGLFRIPSIRVGMLLTFARLFVPATWKSFFPLLLVTSGYAEGIAGTVVAVMALTATVLSLFAGRLSTLGSPASVTAAALSLSIIGVGVAPWMTHPILAIASAILVGVGQGVSLPLLIVIFSSAATEDQRGLALGLRASVNQVAATIAPVAVGSLLGAAGAFLGFPVAAGIVCSALLGATVLGAQGKKQRR